MYIYFYLNMDTDKSQTAYNILVRRFLPLLKKQPFYEEFVEQLLNVHVTQLSMQMRYDCLHRMFFN